MSERDITAEVNALLNAHAEEDIWGLMDTNETAAMICDSYSDSFKDAYGFRPRHSVTVAEALESLKRFQEEAKEEWERDNIPLEGVLFEGKPVKPAEWDDPEKYFVF